MMLDMDRDGDFDRADADIILQIIHEDYGSSGWPFRYVLKKIGQQN